MKGKIVIYTCVTGGYDTVSDPAVLDPRFRFVCFVRKGDPAGASAVWEYRGLPFDESDPTRLVRRAKHCPSELLPDCEWSVWIDGNIDILTSEFYESIADAVSGGVEYGMLRHPFRDDSGEEALRCFSNDRISFREAWRVMGMLRCIPRHSGMIETNVLLRRHNAPPVLAMDRLWWSEMNRWSMRDQLTVMPCLKRSGMDCGILWDGRSTRDFPAVRYREHNVAWVKDTSIRGRFRNLRRETGKLLLKIRLWSM